MHYSRSDIVAACGPNATRAGQSYLREGRVLEATRNGAGISGEVQGSDDEPYRLVVDLRERGKGLRIEGTCSCPVARNCKHVAAVLLSLLDEASEPPGDPVAQRLERLLAPAPTARGAARAGRPAAQAEALPPALARWVAQLDRAQATAGEDYPRSINQRLVYVLGSLLAGEGLPRLALQVISTRLRKDGTFSEGGSPYLLQAGASPARFLRPSDLRIHRLLAGRQRHSIGYGRAYAYDLSDEDAAEILAALLVTGRVRWREPNGPALAAGPPRAGRIAWREEADALRAEVTCEDPGAVLAAAPPVYVDEAAGLIGPVETGLAPRLALALARAPPVPAEAVAALNAVLAEKVPDLAAHRPPSPAAEPLRVAPRPVLRLTTAPIRTTIGYGPYAMIDHETVPIARLAFAYGPVRTELGEMRAVVPRLSGGRLYAVARDPEAEREAARRLLRENFVPVCERYPAEAAHDRDFVREGGTAQWADAQYWLLPRLREEGWEIETAADFPLRLMRADGAFDAEIREGSGIDWLELQLGVELDGERIDLVGPILALLRRPGFDPAILDGPEGEKALVLPLPDGRMLALPPGRLRGILAAIAGLLIGRDDEGRLRLSRADAAGLAALEEEGGERVIWRGGEAIRAMGRRLSASGGIPPVEPPAAFRASLRPYQAQGLAWLAFLRETGFGGVLADDMGLGKTVQALALLALEKAEGRLDRPALVVAPTSLMGNWRRETERFAPSLRVLTLHGLDRKEQFGAMAEHDLVLTTYPLIPRDHAVLTAQEWHILLLDEAQAIKNPDAQTTRLLHGIRARHRFCLTGTPLENSLAEVWSLFAFACPGLLGDRRHFTRAWRMPIEKQGDRERGRLLARRLKPFLLRRTKDEVAGELPPKTEIVERVDLAAGQRDLYESIRLAMHARVRAAIAEKGFARSRIVILDALLKLRQACCDPRLLKLAPPPKAGSVKLDRLDELLESLIAEGRRVLVFSQFTSMLDLIKPRLTLAKTPWLELTGRSRDRAEVVRRFEAGEAPVFLISLKAGGTGLNLVAADTVILYDPWWNPAVEAQAIDRAHRIGQDKPVFVHKLVASRTIEEKMEVLKERKGALADSLFDHDGAPTSAMTAEDLDLLLGE
ncbi:DEAD/DEAH box helicase [Methylobacterium sp. WSM2598]|uniref:DEAD/DEAH box helicase n=1 Tax=Methylobacterium sp. WSM2598 TaxID=398261 RepID=UPI0003800F81|nr:DEAD/DEAH box helicase [Methylobacterium sp. WSM2598]